MLKIQNYNFFSNATKKSINFAMFMQKAEYEEILEYLRGVISGTKWEGKVYVVGGCLRDMLMGHEIHDVDLAVALPDGGVQFPIWLEQEGLTAEPPKLYRRFSSSKLRLKAFPQHEIEVVQTRREQYTDANSRNPEVCFGSIMDDCLRRDLTINSLYQNVTTGEMLDLTGRAIDDIKNHRIMTPMEPGETYSDDPIRILRTLRFAVRYGWEIPDEIMKSMKDNAQRIKIVRRPRVATEFGKIMESNDPVATLQLMKQVGVVFRVVPELCHLFKVKDHTLREKVGPNGKLPTLWDVTMENLAQAGDSLAERYAALFSKFNRVKVPYKDLPKKAREVKEKNRGHGTGAIVTTALKRLMYDYDFIREVKSLMPGLKPGDLDDRIEVKRKRKKKRRRRNGRKRDDAARKAEPTA